MHWPRVYNWKIEEMHVFHFLPHGMSHLFQDAVLSSISPDSGVMAGGTEVTLTGLYLAGHSTVVVIRESDDDNSSGNMTSVDVVRR